MVLPHRLLRHQWQRSRYLYVEYWWVRQLLVLVDLVDVVLALFCQLHCS
jgi:hypothetical protein